MTADAKAARTVGLTRAAGFQVGVRRTLPIGTAAAWRLVTAGEGLRAWLGDDVGEVERGRALTLADGTEVEFRVVEPGSHLRAGWRPPAWRRTSTVQVRVIPAGERTTIAFHHEHLPDAAAREARRARFAAALDALEALVRGGR